MKQKKLFIRRHFSTLHLLFQVVVEDFQEIGVKHRARQACVSQNPNQQRFHVPPFFIQWVPGHRSGRARAGQRGRDNE